MSLRIIACVEDNEIDRKALALAVDDLGDVEVTSFASGREALDTMLAAHPDEGPDVIILDVNLPDLRGDEIIRRLRDASRYQHTPIMVVSGSKDPSAVQGLYEDGANAYLAKPRNFVELVEDYRLCLSFWLRCVSSAPSPLS
ncbi:MAG: response regulator [Myxococcota bacterium]